MGYARAVVVGADVFVSGTTGFDYAAMTIADDVVHQTEQCLRTIVVGLVDPRMRIEIEVDARRQG
jgi:enamine deaminase RidA (YjgF/YER057c/UK114 family)